MRRRPFQPAEATAVIQNQVRDFPGTVGVQMTDLFSGQSAGLNPRSTFYGASTWKVFVAMTVLWLADQGRVSLDQSLTYRPEDYAAGTGILHPTVRPGDRFTVRRLLELLITVSDNIAWNMLERFVGAETIRQYTISLGITPPYEQEQLTASPAGMTRGLVALDSRRSGLSQRSTQQLLDWMQRTIFRDRIPRYLPPDVVVANKIGSWENQFHDIGLIYAPHRSFALSVFTRETTEAQAADLIGRIALALYRYLGSLEQG